MRSQSSRGVEYLVTTSEECHGLNYDTADCNSTGLTVSSEKLMEIEVYE